MASNPTTADAIEQFNSAWRQLENNQTQALQKSYITDNPNPLGEKDKLDYSSEAKIYDFAHKKYHPWFRELLKTRDYYDIFLFDTEGNLVYTVFKENDYATNLLNGPWKDSGLGKVYREAMSNPVAGQFAFNDFTPYAPSNDAPASFIATPVFKDGKLMGVMAYQMSITRLN